MSRAVPSGQLARRPRAGGGGHTTGSACGPPGEAVDDRALWAITGYAIRRTDHALARDFRRHVGGPLALSEVEFALLVLVGENADATQKALCAALGMLPPALAVVLERMEKAGRVERRRRPEDRRLQMVTLTPAGTRLLARARTAADAMQKELRGRLSAPEHTALLGLLAKLRGVR